MIIRKLKLRVNATQLADWPVALQNRVKTIVKKMNGYFIAEQPPFEAMLDSDRNLRVTMRGPDGWYAVNERTGEGTFEPHSDNTRKVFRAFYTP